MQNHGKGRNGANATNGRRDLPIAIIGAGFAGIGTAIQLKKAGIESFTIFERANEVGGTWRDNTYPGAACDVPSHVYSFSFEPNPEWSRKYSPSHEIHAYQLRLVEKWNLRPHIRFGTEIRGASFDEGKGSWTLEQSDGETFEARVVVSCVGGLVDPSYPDIPGIDEFTGTKFHTARWNHDVDLEGKNVAVIGTGASAVQVVPAIAPKVRKLSVFQRTPAWVVPRNDTGYSERTRRLFARFPFLLRLSRFVQYWATELFGPMIILDSPRLSSIGEKMSMAHLRAQVKNPELRKKLTPNFQFGCKRILVSDDYWSTFERENVELVTEGIEAIRPNGIATKDGRVHDFDAIVFATGFDVGLTAAPFPVRGRAGRTLDDAWNRGAVAYKGMTVSGFPNWFILMGPNTGPGHTSVLVYTEAQISYVVQAIERIRRDALRFVDIRQDVQDRYNERIQGRMKHCVWSSGCNSWYLSEDGKNHALFPGLAFEYTARTRNFRPAEYEIARFDGLRGVAPENAPVALEARTEAS